MKRGLLPALAFAAMAAPAGADTILTVGAGGTHATIQSAIDEAVVGSRVYEIHVAGGLWRERVVVRSAEGHLTRISGGWVDGFSRRTDDPALQTVLDGEAGGTVVTIDTEGYVSLTGFVVTGGLAGPRAAGGVSISAHRFGAVELFGNTIRGNRVTSAEAVNGGGLVAGAWDGGHLSIRDNVFERNAAVSMAGMATQGGADIYARDEAFVEVVGNRFFGNEVRSPELAMVSALAVSVAGSAQAHVDLNLLLGNRASGGRFGAFSALRLVTGNASGAARLFARQNQVLGNPTDVPGQQVEVHARGKGAILVLTDSVVAHGNGGGITTEVTDGGTLYLTNLTVTDHPTYGIAPFGEPPYVTNTILFDDGTALYGPVLESHNLKDVDPLFVNPAADDYRLDFGSPAIDAGDNGAPFLGTLDVYGGPRIANGVVDIGADESPAGSGGSSTPCLILSSSVLIDRSVPACRCLSDAGLRQTRCGFFVPDFFLVMLAPFPLPPDPAPVTWTIHPWMPMAGPYRMQAEARIDGQWVPQDWLGPTAKELKDGQLVVEPFKIAPAGKGRTPLRTTLQYLRPGQKGPSSVTMEVLLPAPETKK